MVKKALLLLITLAIISPHARANPLPSRDPQVVVPLLRAFHEHEGFQSIERILGRPDTDIGSAYSITVFRLEDGTSVYVKATPGRNRIFGITRSAPGALAQTLYEPLARDLDHPQPRSAPF